MRIPRSAVRLLLTATLLHMAQPPADVEAGYDRPGEEFPQSRSVTISRNGMVATSHPLAALAGLDVLRAGGSAADAAIAANAVLGVVEPMSCGVGGDLFAIYWDAETGKLHGLNASGRSPYSIRREVFLEQDLGQIPLQGPLPWSVPGCVAGWRDLNERFGRLEMGTILRDAIRHAEEGFPVSEVIARSWRGAEKSLRRWPDSARTFLLDGRAPKEGDVMRNPDLARTLREIAEEGAEAFYTGRVARRIDAFSREHGGFLTLKDLADHTNDWVEPVSTTYRGYRVWELPPNGQGIAALQMLNLLEPYDIRSMGPGSPEYLHLFVEAKKLAFADRARYYADPQMADVPVEELISKEYAKRRGGRIDLQRAATDVPPGDPRLAHGDTVYITVVDKDHNCCSFIQSNYYGFGSMVTPGDVGFTLQNRGALFALEEGHPNVLQPHKRPFHTIIPAMVTRDDRPVFCFGVMGGDMQPQGHVQVLVNLLDFQMNVQQAGDAPRVRHLGSATPTGEPAEGAGRVAVESGVGEETREALRRKGHKIVEGGSFGGYQGIWIDWPGGVLHGASESRKDGMAIGY